MAKTSPTPKSLEPNPPKERGHTVLFRCVQTLRAKGLNHWVWAGCLILVGECLSFVLDEHEPILSIRYRAYQLFQNHGPRAVKPHYTAVVLIDDAAYYNGGYPPRSPIDRTLLATLVSKIAAHKPAVIALDFDLSTGDETIATPVTLPDGKVVTLREYKDYAPQTLKLALAVDAIAAEHPVILSEDIDDAGAELWVPMADAYEGYAFRNKKVKTAHIRLDSDVRKVPLSAPLKEGGALASFSLAAAAAYEAGLERDPRWTAESFAGFLPSGEIPQVSAAELLKTDDSRPDDGISERLQHKIVLVGGGWHTDGNRRGTATIDSQYTPVGEMPGVFVHANYVESLLDGRLLRNGGTILADLFVGVISAVVLALPSKPWSRWTAIVCVLAAPICLCYLSVILIGVYFDVFLIDVLLVGHIIFETVRSWYRNHLAYVTLVREGTIAGHIH
jgi:CHASE2 domain-containing sensor protein